MMKGKQMMKIKSGMTVACLMPYINQIKIKTAELELRELKKIKGDKHDSVSKS